MRTETRLLCLGLSLWLASCGDDDEPTISDAAPEPVDVEDAGEGEDAEVEPPMDASLDAPDAAEDAGPLDAGPSLEARIERGRYLTTHVYPCGGCHTTRTDPPKLFGGIDCYSDSLMNDPNAGCLASRNLTNHETGIKNFSDEEVVDMFRKGLRPDGKALYAQMPYALLGNMNDQDAFAIVAYLRSLPPVDHMVAASQTPFNVPPSAPSPGWPEGDIPLPVESYPERAAALRGRYLAGNFGGCMDCHTPRDMSGNPIRSKAFQGGRTFRNNAIPDPIYAPNLTPHTTGIAGYSVDDLVRAIKRGEDKNQSYAKLCPPMPSGPMGAYGGLSDADALDIAHYLLSLPPVENVIPSDCMLPPPDAGAPDGGTGAGRDAGTDAGADAGG